MERDTSFMRGGPEIEQGMRLAQVAAERNRGKRFWRDEPMGTLIDKIREESDELIEAIYSGNIRDIRLEAGDLIWSAIMATDKARALELDRALPPEFAEPIGPGESEIPPGFRNTYVDTSNVRPDVIDRIRKEKEQEERGIKGQIKAGRLVEVESSPRHYFGLPPEDGKHWDHYHGPEGIFPEHVDDVSEFGSGGTFPLATGQAHTVRTGDQVEKWAGIPLESYRDSTLRDFGDGKLYRVPVSLVSFLDGHIGPPPSPIELDDAFDIVTMIADAITEAWLEVADVFIHWIRDNQYILDEFFEVAEAQDYLDDMGEGAEQEWEVFDH